MRLVDRVKLLTDLVVRLAMNVGPNDLTGARIPEGFVRNRQFDCLTQSPGQGTRTITIRRHFPGEMSRVSEYDGLSR